MIIIEEYTYKEYCESLKNKKELRKQLFDIKMEILYQKDYPEKLKILQEKEKNIKKQYQLNALIIATYELVNNIERGKENDKHKGK